MTAALAERPAAGSAHPIADPVVDRAVAGDDAAFTVLVERHRGELHGHCRRMLASSERAEDALQEALLRAWRARSNFAGRATFRTWLYRIATNACLDEMRRDRWRARTGSATGRTLDDADRTRARLGRPRARRAAGDGRSGREGLPHDHRAAAAEAARGADPLRGAALLLGRGGPAVGHDRRAR